MAKRTIKITLPSLAFVLVLQPMMQLLFTTKPAEISWPGVEILSRRLKPKITVYLYAESVKVYTECQLHYQTALLQVEQPIQPSVPLFPSFE